MKEIKISKLSSTFARSNNINVNSHRSLISFIRNIDVEYLKDKGEAECLSFLFDIVEGTRESYGSLLLNELKYLFDCNDELVGSNILFNMLLNRNLNKMIKKKDFKRINRMINSVSKKYIEDRSSLSDFKGNYYDNITKTIRSNLKVYMEEYMTGNGGYYNSYSVDGLRNIFMNILKEFVLFNTGIYKQILNYQIDKTAIERYINRYMYDFDDVFLGKLEETTLSFEDTVDSEFHDYDSDEEIEKKMADVEVDTLCIKRAYNSLMEEVTAYKVSVTIESLDITTESGFYKLNKRLEKDINKMIDDFVNVVRIELDSYVEEVDLTLDVLIEEYLENIVSNVIFTFVLQNIIMFIHTEPLNNRSGKEILQRLTRDVGFLNLLNDSLDISFDINTNDYIRMDWCR